MSRKPEREKLPPRKPNPDDAWCDHLRAECAKAIVLWMKGSLNPARPIKSLTFDEMQGMAEAATSRWIVLVSERHANPPPGVDMTEYGDLLRGG